MKKADYKDYSSSAYYSGLDGLELKHIEYGINDYLIVQSGSWNGKPKIHRCKVYYNNDNSFIRLYGYKIPLDEFIRM